jgi:4-hydroxy-tetrahydrodipicolinate synthase
MSKPVDSSLKSKLTGVLPPIAMPFDQNSEYVRGGLREQIDFMVESGARAVVVGGSTGEGHGLDDDEFRVAMTEAYEATAGRVTFVAGLIVNSTKQAIKRTKMLDGMKVEALQVTPVHYLFKPDAEATIAHFKAIYEETGIPILIYNVIPWNYLSADLMLRIMDEAPGVVGMKQSSGDLKSVSDLLLRASADKIILTGIDALLYPAFTLGAQGAITALTSAVPSAIVRLFEAVQAGDHATAKDLHFRLNALWNVMPHDILPACVKYVQHLQGLPLFHARAPMQAPSEAQKAAIKSALARVFE